jgi:hypothetical protein
MRASEKLGRQWVTAGPLRILLRVLEEDQPGRPRNARAGRVPA